MTNALFPPDLCLPRIAAAHTRLRTGVYLVGHEYTSTARGEAGAVRPRSAH
jgi:hypothetical protein